MYSKIIHKINVASDFVNLTKLVRNFDMSIFCVLYLQKLSKKYLRCSARMMVVHLQKLLRMKLNIPEEKQVGIILFML